MSLKLSRNKINSISNLIVEHIQNNEEIDYIGNIGNIRLRVYHLIIEILKKFEEIERSAIERANSQKKSVPEGSREWEILFRKYTNHELEKLGKNWE